MPIVEIADSNFTRLGERNFSRVPNVGETITLELSEGYSDCYTVESVNWSVGVNTSATITINDTDEECCLKDFFTNYVGVRSVENRAQADSSVGRKNEFLNKLSDLCREYKADFYDKCCCPINIELDGVEVFSGFIERTGASEVVKEEVKLSVKKND